MQTASYLKHRLLTNGIMFLEGLATHTLQMCFGLVSICSYAAHVISHKVRHIGNQMPNETSRVGLSDNDNHSPMPCWRNSYEF